MNKKWGNYERSFQKLKGIFNFNSLGKRLIDALLSSLLDPLEGLGMLKCGKLELGAAPDF